MSLRLTVCPVHAVERLVAEGGVDEILAVMPPSECEGGAAFVRWPVVTIPRTVVGVSDLGYGELISERELAEILAAHPSLVAPGPEHVDAIIEVGRRAVVRGAGVDWNLLIHCNAGVSRSVAAALCILAIEDGPGFEAESFERLRIVCGDPDPTPNLNLVWHADRALGREGRLFAACGAAVPVACPTVG